MVAGLPERAFILPVAPHAVGRFLLSASGPKPELNSQGGIIVLKKAAVLILVLALVMTFSMTVMAGSNGNGVNVEHGEDVNTLSDFNSPADDILNNPLDVAGN